MNIKKYLKDNIGGDNEQEDNWNPTSLLRRLLEAKIQVDRWNKCVNLIIFHPDQKEYVNSGEGLKTNEYFEGDKIWGAEIIYSNDCPDNQGIVVDTTDYESEGGHNVCVFPVSI